MSNGTLLQAFAGGLGQPLENYQKNGSPGVGETDLQASWDITDDMNGVNDRFSADSFLRGQDLAIIVYGAPAEAADPRGLATYATLQDQKLQAAAQPVP